MKKPPPVSSPVYRIVVTRPAQKQLLRLPKEATDRLQTAIDALAHDPRPSGVKKLKGREGYRIRVGDYRVLYSIFDAVLLVEVVKVGQRGNFYDEQEGRLAFIEQPENPVQLGVEAGHLYSQQRNRVFHTANPGTR